MKAQEFFAKQHAKRWSDPEPPREAQDALAHAYMVGFARARLMAAGLLTDLGGVKNAHLAVLVGAIGKAEVDPETGKPDDDGVEDYPKNDTY